MKQRLLARPFEALDQHLCRPVIGSLTQQQLLSDGDLLLGPENHCDQWFFSLQSTGTWHARHGVSARCCNVFPFSLFLL